jgi:hypothetical protein
MNRGCPHGKNIILFNRDVVQSCCEVSYEYLNDIYVRSALEIIINNLPPDKSKLLKTEINKTDEILKKLIIENGNKNYFYHKFAMCNTKI